MQVRCTLEEERHRHLQNVGDLLQSARPYAVRAFLVFLYLLEGKAECVAQLLLAHCKHHAAHAHPAANVSVDRVWGLLGGGHNNLPWRAANVPAGRPERNRIPSKIDEYCKKLLKDEC